MIEQSGNLWDYHDKGEWIVITTNGFVKKNGEAVMGRGCALECRQRYPEFPAELGHNLNDYGNQLYTYFRYKIFTFPVKYNWYEKADLFLIEKSLSELVQSVNYNLILKVYLPRPGCGNGKLDWETQVKPLCEKYLDDRFIILHYD